MIDGGGGGDDNAAAFADCSAGLVVFMSVGWKGTFVSWCLFKQREGGGRGGKFRVSVKTILYQNCM